MAIPLVKWYLEKGLKITRIYRVTEITPIAGFIMFGVAVSDVRREGDGDPAKGIIVDTMKLIGNSSYGKTRKAIKMSTRDGIESLEIDQRNQFSDLNEIS